MFTYAAVGLDAARVLCFGRDGHVAIEAVAAHHQAIGERVTDADGVGDASPTLNAPVHGPCIDVAVIPRVDLKLGRGDVRDGHPARTPSLQPVMLLADHAEPTGRDVPREARSGLVAVDGPSALTSLRTIVLRI